MGCIGSASTQIGFDVAQRVVLARHGFQRTVYRDGLQFAALIMASLEAEGHRGDREEFGAASLSLRKKTHKERLKVQAKMDAYSAEEKEYSVDVGSAVRRAPAYGPAAGRN